MNRIKRIHNRGEEVTLDYLLSYFQSHMPPISQGETFRSTMKYLVNNPEVIPKFNDTSFFREFHSTLIKVGFQEIEGYKRHYHYGHSISDCNGVSIRHENEVELEDELEHLDYEIC